MFVVYTAAAAAAAAAVPQISRVQVAHALQHNAVVIHYVLPGDQASLHVCRL
jgi:hypothetical protein